MKKDNFYVLLRFYDGVD